MKKLDDLIDEALDNARDDRTKANEFIHKDKEQTSMKFLELRQKANEQLIKMISLFKDQAMKQEEISEDDVDNILETDFSTERKTG